MPNITFSVRIGLLVLLLWVILIAVVGWARPLYPSNEEMHYASIAWEMWHHHRFILPIQGGKPYAEKGPLLFWLIHAGWWMFGVSSWWMRLAPALFGLASLFLLRLFALQVWPNEKKIADLAPLILLGSVVWAAKIPVMRFDIIVTFFIILALYALIRATEVNRFKNWFLLSISIGLGLLVKGPVLFLFILPAAYTVKWWTKSHNSVIGAKIYFHISGAILLGIAIPLLWLIPAIGQGGVQYGYALLLGRSVARIWGTQANFHQNYGFYFCALALMLLPWIIWPPLWSALRAGFQQWRLQKTERGLRLLFIIVFCAFVFLTLIIEKGPRYILPVLPFVTLFLTYFLVKYAQPISRWSQAPIAIAYTLAGCFYMILPHVMPKRIAMKYPWLVHVSPVWGFCCVMVGLFWWCWRERELTKIIVGLTVSTVIFWTSYHLGITKAEAAYNDWRPLARQIATLQANGVPVAFWGVYQELEFFGRFDQPLELILGSKQQWAQQHPSGWVLVRDRSISPTQYRLLSAKTIQAATDNKP